MGRAPKKTGPGLGTDAGILIESKGSERNIQKVPPIPKRSQIGAASEVLDDLLYKGLGCDCFLSTFSVSYRSLCRGLVCRITQYTFSFLHISGALKDAARMPCSHSTVEAAVEVLPSGAARQTADENHSDTLRENKYRRISRALGRLAGLVVAQQSVIEFLFLVLENMSANVYLVAFACSSTHMSAYLPTYIFFEKQGRGCAEQNSPQPKVSFIGPQALLCRYSAYPPASGVMDKTSARTGHHQGSSLPTKTVATDVALLSLFGYSKVDTK